MAKGFNLTAQINLKGPNNLKPIVADIKRQLGSVELKITPKLDIRASKSISSINTRLKTMNSLLASAKSNTDALSAAFSNLSTSLASANSNTVNISGTMQKTATSAASTSKNIKQAATAMEEFGKQGFLAIKRFAAFSLVSTTIFSLINAVNSGLSAFINFDKQLVKLQQVTGKGAIGLKKLEDQITNLSVGLGVSSESLIEVASTLAQAGLNAEETRIALSALAKTELAPSFDDLASTTEGAIAALRQFELQAGDLEAALGSINAVAAAFAVESSDIITAIQRTGGVFAAASRGVSEGKDALNEFIAVFTSVRATTRESAETIATGLRTIFTRIQRGTTIEALKEYGVVLTDLEGKFVGPFEAVKRLSEGLSKLDPRDLRFSQIVEELGGFRQIGKVIPLIQQFSEAQKALKVAQTGQASLADAQLIAQKSLANQIAKVREQFLALIRDVGKSATFQAITKIVLNLTSAFISLASAFKPILPFLAVLGTIKGVKAIGEFGTGFFGSFKKESGTPSAAQSIGSSIGGTISGSKEKEKSAITKLATDAIQANTSAIKVLTIAISNLENTIKSKSTSGFFNGGKVLGFNSGGIVPGSGKGDKVPALLEPGEVVINNKAANKYGRDNLVRMNKYALGGPVEATGKVISGTYSSLKDKIQSDALYRAKIRTRPQPTESIKPIMQNLKKQNPEYPNWKLFEYAVGKKYGFKVAGGNKFLDFPEDLGEAKFMPPNGTYGQDKETGFIKGNNNETMLAKLIGSDKYRKNATITSYYPENISDFRNFVFGGMVQNFKDAGVVEEEYYGQKEVEAAKAAKKALKKTIERMFVDKKGRASFAVKRPVSMSENISQADREQFTKEGRIVSNPTTKLEELLTEKIIRTQATATKSPQTKKKRGVDARLLRNLAKTGIQSDDKQIVEDAEKAIKSMSPEQIKRLLMDDLKRAPEGEYLKKEAEYKLDPEFRKITGLDTGVKGGAVKQFEALAKENVTKGIFERASYLDRIPDALGQIKAFRANLVKKLAQEKDPKIQKNLQQYISKANTAIDVIKNKKGTPELPGQVTALSWAVRQSIPGAKELASGGLVQKFPDGGVAESAIQEELNPQELIAWIEALGIPQDVRGLAGGNSYIDRMLSAVATKGKPVTSKEVFSKTFLKSDRAIPYLSTVKDLLEIADANKKKPRIFTAEEKANATKVGLVGMLPFGLNETHYEEIAGKILSIHTATLPKDKVPAILQMRREIDEVLGRTTQNIFGNPGQNLDDPTKEALGLGNLEGYMIEAILAKAGANPGSLNDRSVDYQMGLGNAANLFGIEPNIPTEIKRDVKSGLSKARANFRNYFAKFASGGSVDGGTVPALVSNGEAFVPPKLAKKIGYDKLHKLNQADRNGAQGFSGGGISVFKGPGSGTSDSIGPIGLPEGSFIIREKATKALGLNKGGIVGGIKRFFRGGQSEKDAVRAQGEILSSIEQGSNVFYEIMDQLPSQIKDIILSKFQGVQNVKPGESISAVSGSPAFTERTRGMAAASTKASAIGLQITGKQGGATTETVAHETGHLADIALGGGTSFASETQGTFQFELIAKIKKQMEDEFKKAGKSAEEIDKYLGTGKELFAEFFAKASPEVRAIITSTTDAKVGMEKLVNALGETGFTYAGLEASDLVPPKPQNKTKRKDQFGFLKTESKSIEAATKASATSFEFLQPKTKTRKEAKKELDDSGLKALTSGISQTSGEIAKLKAQTESLYQQSKNLDNQIGQYDQAILKIRSSTEDGAKGNKTLNRIIQMKIAAETQRLAVDKQAMTAEEQLSALTKQKAQQIAAAKTFKTTGGGGDGPPGGPTGGGGPPFDFGINPQIAAERQRYLQTKAEKAGMSVGGYKYSMAQKLGQNRFNIERETTLAREETKSMAVGRSRELKGVDVAGALKEGNTSQDAQRVQSIISDFTAKLQEANPALTFQQAKDAAIVLATKLSEGKDSVEKIVASNNTLNESLNGSINANILMEETFRRTSVEMGESIENLKANVSKQQLEQQAFIQSTEGQRFGKLAEFAPGLTQKIAGTKVGQGLGKAADFISGKGGKFSKGFAAVGGFQGIGSGLAVGSEALKNSGLISKKTLKDTNVAGAFGAVQGAGAMAATGAELGSFAGPIGTIIGGIGGAVIGGIKGFFDAKNAQILNNALDKLTKSSEGVDVAFKELAKNDTDKNFKNVQKAFGQQIEASKELENIAFGGNESSATGIGGGAAAGALGGAAAGAWIGSIVPVLGTAIGAAVGAGIGGLVGGITGYMSANQNKANREEALRGRVGVAGSMNESAARMAERQMGRMTTEELGAAQTGGVNIIAEQYKQSAIAAAEAANGTKNLTAAQQKKIGQNAMETAYLDAYMKQRKEAGATDQQISEDILADRKLALESGKKALDSQDEAAKKQALLARATKEVALATENLLDVYRRVGANAQRFSDEIDDMLGGVQGRISSLGGKASVQKVDRSGSERILGNMAAYSAQEVKTATQEMVGKLGGGEEAQALGRQAEAAKFLQDKLPSMLRQTGADPSKIISDLSGELRTMGLGGAAIDKMLAEIETQLGKDQEGGLGTLADEISAGGIDKFSMTAAEAAKTLQNLSKTYNDTLQKSIDLQNQYNEVVMQSNEYLRKAGTIRINAELDLAKALGNSPTLAQLNEPFDFEIRDLTKGLVAGGTTDPAAIAAGIVAKTEQNQKLEQANKDIQNRGMTGATSGEAGAKLLTEQQKNIAAMGANSVAINEGRQALERLASDGTKAANALAKIEEQQRQIEGLGNRFEKIFTASPEELFKMNKQSAALQAAQVAGPEQFKSRAFRQDAFAGLEQDKEFLTGEEYRKQRGMLMRKSLEAQGFTGQSMIQKGGVNMTVDDFIKRIEGGVSEEDPNVKAYREAVATQVQANEKLAKLNELQALEIQDAMIGLQVFLSTEFPKILTDAVIAARKDSETKPETKPEASSAEKTKAEADKRYDEAKAKRGEIESQINQERLGISKAKENKWWDPAGSATEIKQRQNRIKELKAKEAEQTSIMNEADATSAEAERTIETEKKTKAETKAAQLAEEKKTKESTVSSSIEQSQRVREGMPPPSIPAPPAPGAQSRREANQARAAELRQELKDIEQRKPQSIQNTALQQTQAMTQVSGAAKPQISPETPVSKPVVEKLSPKEKARLISIGSIAPDKRTTEQQETYTSLKQRKATAGEPEKILTPYQQIQKQKKEAFLSNKKAKREAYLSSLRPEIREKKLTKAEKAERASRIQTSEPDISKAPTLGTLFGPENTPLQAAATVTIPQGGMSAAATPGAERIPQDPNSLRVASQPVPSNLPKPVEYTRQVQAAETGTTPSATKTTETSAQLITLDPASIEGLNTFNTNFGSYVDKLVNFQFPTIPEKIEMVGNHVVDVRVSGAAAFESIEKGMKDMINKAIDDKMTEIWKQTGGAIGNRPGAPPPKGK